MFGARLLGPAVRDDAFAGLDDDRRFTADELADLLKADAEAEEEDARGECIPAEEVIARLRRRLT